VFGLLDHVLHKCYKPAVYIVQTAEIVVAIRAPAQTLQRRLKHNISIK